jgi:Transposase DDE domain
MVVFYVTFVRTRRPRMAAFDLALARVREQDIELLQHLPERVNRLARAAELTFRETELTPGNTLALFLRQVACGNVACAAVRHLAGSDFTDSVRCQARKRLPIDLIRQAHQLLVDGARRELDATDDAGAGAGAGGYRWRGHRVHVVDGTSDSMPDTPPLRAHYGVPSGCRPGLGFPTSHLLLLMDHRSGLFLDCVDGPLVTSDVPGAPTLHAHLAAGDVLLGDDAFAGWAHLALVLQANLHAIFPAHHRRIVDFTAGRAHAHPRRGKSGTRAGKPRSRVVEVLGPDDQRVEYFKPAEQPAWIGDER